MRRRWLWQAVYSPVGEDGYPQPILDKTSGVIDHKTAEYWRAHYDLNAILQRDWETLGLSRARVQRNIEASPAHRAWRTGPAAKRPGDFVSLSTPVTYLRFENQLLYAPIQ